MTQNTKYLISLVDKCREERDIGQRIAILETINSSLPLETKISIPSFITNSCVDNILSAIEVRLSPPIYNML
ncbi:MAG TPA: hypothetical protein VHH33_08425 [Nitrososphaeraceae archaeon]|jgi:hypothetical protein|nr:hypothetical protein [Nitrososphaeraceae archaeon]